MNYPHDGGYQSYPQQQSQKGASDSYYGASNEKYPHTGHPGAPPGPEGERGMGSKILGATGGGFLGHKIGGGMLGTAGGALAGAAGMSMASKM